MGITSIVEYLKKRQPALDEIRHQYVTFVAQRMTQWNIFFCMIIFDIIYICKTMLSSVCILG